MCFSEWETSIFEEVVLMDLPYLSDDITPILLAQRAENCTQLCVPLPSPSRGSCDDEWRSTQFHELQLAKDRIRAN
jgi:hypothetical protein